MRLRKKKHRDERMDACAQIMVSEPYPQGKWNEIFGNNNKIYLEIGCGKGRFVLENAIQNPDINYVAIEKCADAILLAMEKALAANVTNIRYICGNADCLEHIFTPGEVSRIFLNFSDPWHKSKHGKRRLTHKNFLSKYRQLLELVHGEVHFKTDNQKFFEFSLNEIAGENIKLRNISLDLHASDFEGNIMTEYEQMFSQMGKPIYRLEAHF